MAIGCQTLHTKKQKTLYAVKLGEKKSKTKIEI